MKTKGGKNMNLDEIVRKVENGEGLTVKEIKLYQRAVKQKKHTYGKYGTLAKLYLEEQQSAKYWALADDLPEYLHGIDRQADALYETMYANLSTQEEYKKTGDFISDWQKETKMQKLIEEEILTELVYVQ